MVLHGSSGSAGHSPRRHGPEMGDACPRQSVKNRLWSGGFNTASSERRMDCAPGRTTIEVKHGKTCSRAFGVSAGLPECVCWVA